MHNSIFNIKALVLILSILSTAMAAALNNHVLETDTNIDLEIDNSNNNNLDATNTAALSLHAKLAACAPFKIPDARCGSPHDLKELSSKLGEIIKARSDAHMCSPIFSIMDNIQFEYYATGRDCNTGADESKIANAILEYFDQRLSGIICETACLRLKYGGSWTGYLKIGHKSVYDYDAQCDGYVADKTCAFES